jgi:hypothetical protein
VDTRWGADVTHGADPRRGAHGGRVLIARSSPVNQSERSFTKDSTSLARPGAAVSVQPLGPCGRIAVSWSDEDRSWPRRPRLQGRTPQRGGCTSRAPGGCIGLPPWWLGGEDRLRVDGADTASTVARSGRPATDHSPLSDRLAGIQCGAWPPPVRTSPFSAPGGRPALSTSAREWPRRGR